MDVLLDHLNRDNSFLNIFFEEVKPEANGAQLLLNHLDQPNQCRYWILAVLAESIRHCCFVAIYPPFCGSYQKATHIKY